MDLHWIPERSLRVYLSKTQWHTLGVASAAHIRMSSVDHLQGHRLWQTKMLWWQTSAIPISSYISAHLCFEFTGSLVLVNAMQESVMQAAIVLHRDGMTPSAVKGGIPTELTKGLNFCPINL